MERDDSSPFTTLLKWMLKTTEMSTHNTTWCDLAWVLDVRLHGIRTEWNSRWEPSYFDSGNPVFLSVSMIKLRFYKLLMGFCWKKFVLKILKTDIFFYFLNYFCGKSSWYFSIAFNCSYLENVGDLTIHPFTELFWNYHSSDAD